MSLIGLDFRKGTVGYPIDYITEQSYDYEFSINVSGQEQYPLQNSDADFPCVGYFDKNASSRADRSGQELGRKPCSHQRVFSPTHISQHNRH